MKKFIDPEIARYLGYPEDTEFDVKPQAQVEQEQKEQEEGAKEFMAWMDEREYQESEMYWDQTGGDL